MKKERVILSFIALLIGLAVAGGAFYFYQKTQTAPSEEVETDMTDNTQEQVTGEEETRLSIDKPKNEEVVTSQTVTVSGRTLPDTTLVVQSESDEQVATVSSNGTFQFTVDIEDGLNILNITALYPDGTQETTKRIITYSQEDF